mmetsp:Transcript_96552/g.295363  ORF Transcript_96552/g.295363 Transcript_96552/m.295363 type:complete len:264 (-) Transcript_96552:1095-1886(-)
MIRDGVAKVTEHHLGGLAEVLAPSAGDRAVRVPEVVPELGHERRIPRPAEDAVHQVRDGVAVQPRLVERLAEALDDVAEVRLGPLPGLEKGRLLQPDLAEERLGHLHGDEDLDVPLPQEILASEVVKVADADDLKSVDELAEPFAERGRVGEDEAAAREVREVHVARNALRRAVPDPRLGLGRRRQLGTGVVGEAGPRRGARVAQLRVHGPPPLQRRDVVGRRPRAHQREDRVVGRLSHGQELLEIAGHLAQGVGVDAMARAL